MSGSRTVSRFSCRRPHWATRAQPRSPTPTIPRGPTCRSISSSVPCPGWASSRHPNSRPHRKRPATPCTSSAQHPVGSELCHRRPALLHLPRAKRRHRARTRAHRRIPRRSRHRNLDDHRSDHRRAGGALMMYQRGLRARRAPRSHRSWHSRSSWRLAPRSRAVRTSLRPRRCNCRPTSSRSALTRGVYELRAREAGRLRCRDHRLPVEWRRRRDGVSLRQRVAHRWRGRSAAPGGSHL